MTRPQLIVRNLLRNRRRTLLTVGSVAVSIFLLVVLSATYRYLSAPAGTDRLHQVLIVSPRTSLMVPLPLSYRERIARLPGVESVTPMNWFDGRYGGEETPLPAFACDPLTLLAVFPQWQIPADKQQAFVSEKASLLAGRMIAERYRWKVGDHIHLSSPSYRVSLDLVLRAIYASPGEDETMLAFHWDYLNEAMGRPDKPGAFWVLARTPEDASRLMKDVDTLFRNEAVETNTQNMKQFVLGLLSLLGNVRLILMSICTAVVFAVLLIVANTMAMSIRERTSELAVLRTLGFGAKGLLGMLAMEALAISLSGAALGCLAAHAVTVMIRGYRIGGLLPSSIQVDVATLTLAFGVAAGVGLLATLVPAHRASRANIAQALRFVG
jgi:putative ABC transport system permease protein